MNEICRMSARELTEKVGRKALSSLEVVDAMLARIEACADFNAFVCTVPDQAREAARALDQAPGKERGALAGVPYSAKDVTNCQGVPTRYGSKALPAYLPPADNLAVSRARAAGAILLGKTTTPELAHKALTYSPLSGLTLNPFSPHVTSGGSSGGAAVAVALGMGPVALGTDGGGSVRIPAACCGIVGMKPSIGSLPDPQGQDLFGVSAGVGPMARNVADLRLFYQVLEGGHVHDPYSQGRRPEPRQCRSLEGVRVAWMPKCGNKAVDTEVERLSSAAVRRMQDLGAIVEEVEVDFARLEPHFFVLMETRIARSLRALDEQKLQDVDPSLLVHFRNAARHTAMDYMDALSERGVAFRQVQDVLQRFDVIASPTMSAPPLAHEQDPHGPIVINGQATGLVRAEWYPYTMGFNLTGHPAISIPCGYTDAGLPVGFQLAGRWLDEAYLLDVAESVEGALGVRTLADMEFVAPGEAGIQK